MHIVYVHIYIYMYIIIYVLYIYLYMCVGVCACDIILGVSFLGDPKNSFGFPFGFPLKPQQGAPSKN